MKFAFMCKKRQGGGGRGKVAVVGGGPAGLAATGYLVCQGYEVDVYEKLPLAGGLMMFGIPPYRIPRDSVMEGTEDLEKNFGVKFIYRTKVFCGEPRHDEGDEFVNNVVDLKKVMEEYDAVLLTTGIWSSRRLGVPGDNAKGVFSALEYVYSWWTYELGYSTHRPLVGNKVVVIGGGYSAIDAAEVALMKGAKEVYLTYRRTIKEAPAGEYEIRRVASEGVKWVELVQPTKVVVSGDRVVGVEFVKMKLGEPDETGRPRPMPVPGTEHVIEADTVLAAVGEIPTPPLGTECDGIKVDPKRRTVIVNERMQTGVEKVFAAGDVVTGPSMVGKAIGSGLKAATHLDHFLRAKRVL
ncbi:MAG: FAD-dependent oxidoreductase [Zestosphaera sp.]